MVQPAAILESMPISPAALRHAPFTVADAAALGLSWDDLQTSSWTRLSRGQYAWSRLRRDNWLILRAVAQRVPPEYAFSGPTAAWLLGLDVSPCEPVEITIPRGLPVRTRAGVRVRRADLPDCDVITHQGFRITTPIRTVCEMGSRADLVESVVSLDMALHAGLVDPSNLIEHLALHAGGKGTKRLRRASGFADGRSESPMETRLRMVLIRARLPRPCVQTELFDGSGSFVGRVDLYLPESTVGHRVRRRQPSRAPGAGYPPAKRPRQCRLPRAPVHRPGSSESGIGCSAGPPGIQDAAPNPRIVAPTRHLPLR